MADDHRPVHAETSEEEGITSPLDFVDPEIANIPLANATLGTLVTTLQAASISYSAPMPPASEFAAFDNALPGTALVIRTMAVDEQKHRHSLEDREMTLRERGQQASIDLSRRGQVIAAVFGALVLALAYYLFRKDAFSQAAAVAIASMLAFAIAFFTGHLPDRSKD